MSKLMKPLNYILPFLIMISISVLGQTKPKTTKPVKKPVTKTTTKPVLKQEPVFMLVKIKSSVFNNDFVGDAAVRQRIEDKIDEQLMAVGIGEWVSGDLGPGEANILYKVKNTDQAVKIILKVLNEEKFEKKIFIGTRISKDKIPWTYKVIYSKNYKGTL